MLIGYAIPILFSGFDQSVKQRIGSRKEAMISWECARYIATGVDIVTWGAP